MGRRRCQAVEQPKRSTILLGVWLMCGGYSSITSANPPLPVVGVLGIPTINPTRPHAIADRRARSATRAARAVARSRGAHRRRCGWRQHLRTRPSAHGRRAPAAPRARTCRLRSNVAACRTSRAWRCAAQRRLGESRAACCPLAARRLSRTDAPSDGRASDRSVNRSAGGGRAVTAGRSVWDLSSSRRLAAGESETSPSGPEKHVGYVECGPQVSPAKREISDLSAFRAIIDLGRISRIHGSSDIRGMSDGELGQILRIGGSTRAATEIGLILPPIKQIPCRSRAPPPSVTCFCQPPLTPCRRRPARLAVSHLSSRLLPVAPISSASRFALQASISTKTQVLPPSALHWRIRTGPL